MARKLKNMENETQTVFDLDNGEKIKNVENEKQILFDLDVERNTE